jgi:acyl-CoA reductase-like NAD-dependent aldehyde dehydrogenase
MTVFDKDLYSVQEARILAEAAAEAKTALAELSQEQLDAIVFGMLDAVMPHIPVLARQACEETGYGVSDHKIIKDTFICQSLKKRLFGMQCVGVLGEDTAAHTMQIGVPVGVIAAFAPATSPVATTIPTDLWDEKPRSPMRSKPSPAKTKRKNAK